MLNQRFNYGNEEVEAPPSDYESHDEDVDFENSNGNDELLLKRRKLNEDERVQRCRERNRIHARNTRERKRAQMDLLQQRIQELSDEKKSLENYEPEESVASILMSLSSSPKTRGKYFEDGAAAAKDFEQLGDESSKRFAADAIERIKSEISATLSDDEELEMNSEILLKDKSACSSADLEMIRRERNRMHAKKTRLRKKKMLSEMESIILGLERDIRDLRQRHNLGPDEYTGSMDFRRRPSNANSSLTISGSVGGSKFTGFRHVHRSEGAVVVKGAFSEASLSSNGSTTSASTTSSSSTNNNTSSAAEASFASAAAQDGTSSSNAQKLSLGVAQQLAKATAALKERELVSSATSTGTAGRQPSSTEIGAAFKPYKRESALVSPSVTSSNRSIRSNSTSSNSSQSGEQQFQHPSAGIFFRKTPVDSTENYLGLQSLQGHNQGKNQDGGRLKRTISDLTNTNSNNGCGYDSNNNNNQDASSASRTGSDSGSGSGSGSPNDNDDRHRSVNMLYLAATAAAANDA